MINGADIVEKRKRDAEKDTKFGCALLAIVVPLLILIGLMVIVVFEKSHYEYVTAYVDKNQTMWELQHNDKQHKYRVREFISVKEPNGISEWKYSRTLNYGESRPQLAHVYAIDDYREFLNNVHE